MLCTSAFKEITLINAVYTLNPHVTELKFVRYTAFYSTRFMV